MPVTSMVKQYGEIRTGTNYLRALIQRNFPDVQVLSYILGSKHLPPAPFAEIWEETQQAGSDTAFDFVATATYSRRGGASHPKDRTQQEELRQRAPRIATAYETGALGFLVSIKHPYAWVVSAARFNGWLRDDGKIHDCFRDALKDACLGYNRNYRSWLELAQAHRPRTCIVRYEELLADPGRVVGEMAAQFGWNPCEVFTAVPAIVEPTPWDHLPVAEAAESFRPEYYSGGEYLRHLPPEQLQLIDALMDWDLMRELGYARS